MKLITEVKEEYFVTTMASSKTPTKFYLSVCFGREHYLKGKAQYGLPPY
jgi:hypothetical protein